MNIIKQNPVKQNVEKTFEQLEKSEKRFKIGMAVIFFIISFAVFMIILGIVSSL